MILPVTLRKPDAILAGVYVLALSLVLSLPILRTLGDGGLASWLVTEDAIFETLGALACLTGGVLIIVALVCGQRADGLPGTSFRQRSFLLLLAMAFVLMFLEETSWCQRLFQYETPNWLAAINTPREANLHNLVIFQPTPGVNRLQFVLLVIAVIYFFLVPTLALIGPIRAALSYLGLYLPPIWIPASLLLLTVADAALESRAPQTPPPLSIQEHGEVFEAVLEITCGFLAAAVFCQLATQRAIVAFTVLTIAVLVPLSAVFLSGAIPPSLAAARSEGLRLHADCVLLNSGMNDASLIYESAVRLWPDNWRAHYQLGIAARERGDSHTSVSHFREIVRSKPDDAGIRLLLGVELVASGDLNGARDEILRSLEVSGPNVVTLTQLAIVDCALGRHDQALHSLERALGLEPGNAKVRRMIEQIHQSQSLP